MSVPRYEPGGHRHSFASIWGAITRFLIPSRSTTQENSESRMSLSPTKRTLDRCREYGWKVAVVETWNHWSNTRMDLFGFIDVLALTGSEIVGIQCTSYSNIPARVTKIKTETQLAAKMFLASGGRIEVWGWKRGKKRGEDGKYWQVRKVVITECDV